MRAELDSGQETIRVVLDDETTRIFDMNKLNEIADLALCWEAIRILKEGGGSSGRAPLARVRPG